MCTNLLKCSYLVQLQNRPLKNVRLYHIGYKVIISVCNSCTNGLSNTTTINNNEISQPLHNLTVFRKNCYARLFHKDWTRCFVTTAMLQQRSSPTMLFRSLLMQDKRSVIISFNIKNTLRVRNNVRSTDLKMFLSAILQLHHLRDFSIKTASTNACTNTNLAMKRNCTLCFRHRQQRRTSRIEAAVNTEYKQGDGAAVNTAMNTKRLTALA